MAGLVPLPGAVPYGVSKHGVVALSEGLYLELRTIGSPIGVSCLCPGFVRTDLLNSPWNVRHGAAPPATDDEVGSMTFDLLRDGVDGGMPPGEVAAAVVDAIRTDRFWILTHTESRGVPVARMRRAARQENPTPDPELARLVRALRARRLLGGIPRARRR
jgi:NAD(P)-dependent dehydrogenase (short-subunit alcohol dehydrogenase family)